MPDKPNKKIKRLKTGPMERRFSVAKAGVVAGSRLAAQSAGNFFTSKDRRAERQREILSRQAHYLVEEIGKLKGSIVKIGQMMALYGEHFLPKEVTTALHTLEDDTAALEWTSIYEVLEDELGVDKLALLEIEEDPIGAASIGQVHRATIKSSGAQICLKVQYPGIADAVDSDLNAMETLIKVLKIVPMTDEFHTWYAEIRDMMHREVNYFREKRKTELFGERLQDDSRFIVPQVVTEFCSAKVIALSYEPGISVDDDITKGLPQERRNAVCEAALDLCWREVFEWGEMQTDPNFGNYFIRLADEQHPQDRIVLLDFGAVRAFSNKTLNIGHRLVKAAHEHDQDTVGQCLRELNFFSGNPPEATIRRVAQLCFMAIEPFVDPARFPPPEGLVTEQGEYLWQASNLPARLTSKASTSLAGGARYFTVPPREIMFLIRKIMGAYTFMSVLDAKLRGDRILLPYLN